MSDALTVVADVVAAVALLAGSVLTFSAALGVRRFPDLLSRMHAATKPQVLGTALLLLGLSLRIRSAPVVGMLVLVVLFQMLTTPTSSHMVARAGYRTGRMQSDLVVDELTRDLDAARRAHRGSTPPTEDDEDDEDELLPT